MVGCRLPVVRGRSGPRQPIHTVHRCPVTLAARRLAGRCRDRKKAGRCEISHCQLPGRPSTVGIDSGASPMNRRPCHLLAPALCRRACSCRLRPSPFPSGRRVACTFPDRSVAVASAAELVEGSYRGVALDPHVGRVPRLALQPRGPLRGALCRKSPSARPSWPTSCLPKGAQNATGNGLAPSVFLLQLFTQRQDRSGI